LVVAAVAAFLALSHNKDEAPFSPVQVDAHLVGLHVDGQIVMGQLEVAGRTAPVGTAYQLIVVDNRVHRVAPMTSDVSGSADTAATLGWDGAAGSLHHQYDWQPSGQEQAASFTPGTTTSLRFSARLASDSLPVTKLRSDLSVILALTRGSDHVYWSVKLK
jgi:hypothetical protein